MRPANINRQSSSVGTLGMQYYKEGKIETAMEHEPDYLRVSQAEREREETGKCIDFSVIMRRCPSCNYAADGRDKYGTDRRIWTGSILRQCKTED